jgi:flagellum-specific peptidoglycan hydrolase FlgJ
MTTASKPWWQQATALVSLSASGTITGFSVSPHGPAEMPQATPAQVRLLAFRQMAKPTSTAEVTFRSAIVAAARYYLRLAQHRTPAEMEAMIWQHDSVNGADHGESCAAFASLTLEMASKVVGRDSWVTGGTSYPWPLHAWADVRVDPNPASPGIVSMLQDAQAHHRWHPLGDGYTPQPGDWVLFDGHVEVVTQYAGGVLSTIGGDSLPNLSVNAHEYRGSLAGNGVVGFVNNDEQVPAPGRSDTGAGQASAGSNHVSADAAQTGNAAIPGLTASAPGAPPGNYAGTRTVPVPPQGHGHRHRPNSAGGTATTLHPHRSGHGQGLAHAGPASTGSTDAQTEADVPGAVRFGPAAEFQKVRRGAASIPGATAPVGRTAAASAPPHRRYQPPSGTVPAQTTPAQTTPAQLSSAQRAFIDQVVPGALAAQREYGVPASVTIAQAIDESGWGQSGLATKDHNLFGIKGEGPAGSDTQLTEEYVDGHWQVTIASFRAYHNVAQSIADHGKLLATSGYYQAAMAHTQNPDAFASALTGIYATDPQYGHILINLMRQYNLYQYDQPGAAKSAPSGGTPAQAGTSRPATPGTASIPGATAPSPGSPAGSSSPAPGEHTGGAGSRSAGGQGASGHGGGHRGTGHGSRPRRGGTPGRGSTPPGHGTTPPVSTPPRVSPASPGATPAPGRPAGRKTPASPPGPEAPAASPSPSPSLTPAAVPPISAPPARLSATLRPGRQPASHDRTATATLLAKRTVAPTPRQARPAKVQTAVRYDVPLPRAVRNSFVALARTPIMRSESLYQDVAGDFGLPWELLAACDWMQCESKPRHSPVHGERLGTRNPDGTEYHTRSEALAQCAEDLLTLADEVYGIELTSGEHLSVRDLANAYAAFRWGSLLKTHRTSAMEFPYSVAGLTGYKVNMRWPAIDEPNAPDKPGTRFKRPFGAVPVVLALGYPATAPPGQA